MTDPNSTENAEQPDLDAGFLLDGWSVEPRRSCVTSPDGEERHLEPRAMSTLVFLAGRATQVMRRDELIDAVWQTTVSDEVLSRAISLIRAALGDDPRTPRFVETVPKIGYRLLQSPVTNLASSISSPAEPAAPAPPDDPSSRERDVESESGSGADHLTQAHSPTATTAGNHPATDTRPRAPMDAEAGVKNRPPRRRWLIAAASLLALALGIQLLLQDPTSAPPPAPIQSIAVLPLEDVTLHESAQPIGSGLSDVIRTGLARNDGLRVLARGSSMSIARELQDSRAVGASFGIDAMLEGSVIHEPGAVRVQLALSDARDGYQRWAQTFEAPPGDLFGLGQQMIAGVETALGSVARVSADPLYEPDPLAHTAYLQGMQHLASRGDDGLQRAAARFEEAIAADPHYDLARVALARAWMLRPYHSDVSEPEAFSRALRELQSIGETRDPQVLGQAAAIRGLIHFRSWNWSAAQDEFDAAIVQTPQDAQVRAWYAEYLSALDRPSESLEQALEAWRLDPGSATVGSRVAIAHLWRGDAQRAYPFYDTSDPVALAIRDPSYLIYLLEVGRDDEVNRVMAEIQHALRLDATWIPAALHLIRSSSEDSDRPAALREYERAQASGQVPPRFQLAIWILAGEFDSATDWIEAHRESRQYVFVEFLFSRQAEGYRAHPGFQRALQILGHPSASMEQAGTSGQDRPDVQAGSAH